MVARRETATSGESIGAVRCDRPQTGAEYLESLPVGRYTSTAIVWRT
jgi:hypothetical protein